MPKEEFMDIIEDMKGYTSVREVQKPEGWENRLQEVRDLLSGRNGMAPHRREFLIREALTTSDFPLLFGDVLNREVLASYKAVDPVWRPYFRIGRVDRIYPQIGAKRFAISGGDQYLAEVAEKTEYPESDRDEAKYDIYVKKYGRTFDISWETIINDRLGALNDTPVRFATAATRTEHRLAVGLYAGDVGTHAGGNLYENGVNEGVLTLTIDNLQTSISNMRKFVDANGEPIKNDPKYLVVGPDLEWTARAILTSALKMYVDVQGGAGASIMPFPTANVVTAAGLTLIVDPYIPVLDASYVNSWYLFAAPADIAAVEFDYLEGHETPEICMKDSDKVSVGGGAISPLEGDFESDNIKYRVRLVCGANKLDWRGTYMNQVAT